MPCIESATPAPEVFGLMATERERIESRIRELVAARDALDALIEVAAHPTPEHCPAMRRPPWSSLQAERSDLAG